MDPDTKILVASKPTIEELEMMLKAGADQLEIKMKPDGSIHAVERTGRPLSWRDANFITDREFAEIGLLLCDHTPRDLALMVVRLQGQLEAPKLIGSAQ